MLENTENLTADEIRYLESKKGKILNPRMDGTFKAMFTQPTAESRKALHSFLEAVLVRKIDAVKFEPNDAVQQFASQRDVDYDINVRFSTGESAEIEMQAWRQNYDYGKRAEYQAARLLSTYLNDGDSWDKVQKVYQISILDYNYYTKQLFDEVGNRIVEKRNSKKSVVNYYTMKNQDGERLSSTLNIVFIELTRLEKDYSDDMLEKLSAAEKWALFLKNADNNNDSEIVKKLTKTEEGIMDAQTVLSSISSDRALWLQQYHAEVRERDRISNLEGAKNEGFELGIKEGIKEGMKSVLSYLQEGHSLEEALAKFGNADSESAR